MRGVEKKVSCVYSPNRSCRTAVQGIALQGVVQDIALDRFKEMVYDNTCLVPDAAHVPDM